MYRRPSLYDILATPGTAEEVDVLERLHRRFAAPSRGRPACLEPACGTGRYLRVFAGRGWRAVGFDAGVEMVAYARASLRRRGLTRRTRVLRADMGDFTAGLETDGLKADTFDLAFIPDNSLRHLMSDREARTHLEGVARVLKPGGVYVVGLSLTGEDGDPAEEDVWSAARGRCRVTQLVNYQPPGAGGGFRRERVISHLMVERPCGVEHLDGTYDLRTYTERQWMSLVARSPLRRAASLDRHGLPRDGRRLAYQLEILVRR